MSKSRRIDLREDSEFLANPSPRCWAEMLLKYTTEFAAMRTGVPTKNPYNLKHTPGGTSSGSAAAVGDWQCQVAFGTQTVSLKILNWAFTVGRQRHQTREL